MELYDPTTGTWYEYSMPAGGALGASVGGTVGGAVGGSIGPWQSGGAQGASPLQPISSSPYAPAGPTPTGPLILNATGDADTDATNLINAQFANWQQQYKPIEQNLLQQDSLENPDVLTSAVSNAQASAQNSGLAMQGVQARQLASQGVQPDARQSAQIARIGSLATASNVAGAENTARQNVNYNNELIALGSAPNPNIYNQQQNASASSNQQIL